MALLTAQQTALEIIVNMCCTEGLLPAYARRYTTPSPPLHQGLFLWEFL